MESGTGPINIHAGDAGIFLDGSKSTIISTASAKGGSTSQWTLGPQMFEVFAGTITTKSVLAVTSDQTQFAYLAEPVNPKVTVGASGIQLTAGSSKLEMTAEGLQFTIGGTVYKMTAEGMTMKGLKIQTQQG